MKPAAPAPSRIRKEKPVIYIQRAYCPFCETSGLKTLKTKDCWTLANGQVKRLTTCNECAGEFYVIVE